EIGERPHAVLFVAVAVSVARQVEPVTAPTLAKMRRGEQTIHQSLVGVRRRVSDEFVHFLRRRRQAEKIETEPPDQCHAFRFGRRLEPLLLQPRQDEGVDWIAHPLGVFDGGDGGTLGSFKGPMITARYLACRYRRRYTRTQERERREESGGG